MSDLPLVTTAELRSGDVAALVRSPAMWFDIGRVFLIEDANRPPDTLHVKVAVYDRGLKRWRAHRARYGWNGHYADCAWLLVSRVSP